MMRIPAAPVTAFRFTSDFAEEEDVDFDFTLRGFDDGA